MFDREKMLKCVINMDERIYLAKVIDRAFKAYKSKETSHSDFLDPNQQAIVKKAMDMQDEVQYEFDGGYEGAERSVAFFYPFGDYFESGESPLRLLNIKARTECALSHRDYLGALMSLGIKREKIGDILVREQGCSLLLSSDISDYVLYNLVKVGRTKFDIEYGDLELIEVPDIEVKDMRVSVASLRLDCIVAAGFGMSRSRVSEVIKSDRVNVNFETVSDISKTVKTGDTISVRGRGRMYLEAEGNKTRKGKISVLLKRLV